MGSHAWRKLNGVRAWKRQPSATLPEQRRRGARTGAGHRHPAMASKGKSDNEDNKVIDPLTAGTLRNSHILHAQ